MGNRELHSTIGRQIGLKEYLDWLETTGRDFDSTEAQICITVGRLAAELPDRLEPAISPTHRRKAHSWEAYLILSYLASQNTKNTTNEFSNLLWEIFMKGYRSHLNVDSRTPMGLPSVVGEIVRGILD